MGDGGLYHPGQEGIPIKSQEALKGLFIIRAVLTGFEQECWILIQDESGVGFPENVSSSISNLFIKNVQILRGKEPLEPAAELIN